MNVNSPTAVFAEADPAIEANPLAAEAIDALFDRLVADLRAAGEVLAKVESSAADD